MVRTFFYLRAEWNFVEVWFRGWRAAEEEDAEEDEGGEGGDDLEAAWEVGAGIYSAWHCRGE